MKFVVYGVEVNSPVVLPLMIPAGGESDQIIRLSIERTEKQAMNPLAYETPVSGIHGRSARLSSNQPLSLSRVLIERCWKIDIQGLFSFSWCNASNHMTIDHAISLDLHKLSFWLLHTVIPIYLMLKQSSPFLHASAVEVEGKALLFLAPSYGGKSTLADYFVQNNQPVLSDDKVRFHFRDNQYFVFPSYPYRRPYRDFEELGHHSEHFSRNPLPVTTHYLLNYVDADDSCSVQQVRGLKKIEVLKKAYLYEPVSMSAVEIEYLMHLGKHSSLYRVNVPKDLTRLPEVYQMIVEHATHLDVVP